MAPRKSRGVGLCHRDATGIQRLSNPKTLLPPGNRSLKTMQKHRPRKGTNARRLLVALPLKAKDWHSDLDPQPVTQGKCHSAPT